MRILTLLLVAGICAAETAPPAPAVPAKATTVTTRTTRVVIVRAPVRYYGYSLLGNLIGASIVGAVEAHRNNRLAERAAAEAALVPYVPQYADAPVQTEMIIESNPPGARVVINGAAVGVTPLTGQQNAGSVYLLIRLDGYQDEIHEFRAGGAPVHIIAELKHAQ